MGGGWWMFEVNTIYSHRHLSQLSTGYDEKQTGPRSTRRRILYWDLDCILVGRGYHKVPVFSISRKLKAQGAKAWWTQPLSRRPPQGLGDLPPSGQIRMWANLRSTQIQKSNPHLCSGYSVLHTMLATWGPDQHAVHPLHTRDEKDNQVERFRVFIENGAEMIPHYNELSILQWAIEVDYEPGCPLVRLITHSLGSSDAIDGPESMSGLPPTTPMVRVLTRRGPPRHGRKPPTSTRS